MSLQQSAIGGASDSSCSRLGCVEGVVVVANVLRAVEDAKREAGEKIARSQVAWRKGDQRARQQTRSLRACDWPHAEAGFVCNNARNVDSARRALPRRKLLTSSSCGTLSGE